MSFYNKLLSAIFKKVALETTFHILSQPKLSHTLSSDLVRFQVHWVVMHFRELYSTFDCLHNQKAIKKETEKKELIE